MCFWVAMRPCICLCHWSVAATEHTGVRSGRTEHLNPFHTWCLMDSAHICEETWATICSNDLWWSWRRGSAAPAEYTPLVLSSVQPIIAKLLWLKRLLCIKKVLYCIKWLERGHLSCQWFKTFYFCTYSCKRGCLFIYLALQYEMDWAVIGH